MRRWPLIPTAAAIVGVGMAARFGLSGVVANVAGVALWSVLVYVLVLLVRPSLAPVMCAGVTLGVSWAVELFQLTPIPLALAEVSVLFRLALGTHFDPLDLPAYLLGVLVATGAHRMIAGRP